MNTAMEQIVQTVLHEYMMMMMMMMNREKKTEVERSFGAMDYAKLF